MRQRWWLIFVSGLIWVGCHRGETPAARPADPAIDGVRVSGKLIESGAIRVEPVSMTTEPISLETSGKVGFDEDHLSYVSSPLVGRVTEIRAHRGEHVAAGQTLAVIDSPDLGQAWSEFIKARADVLLAERGATLAQELWAAKAMATKDLQKAKDRLVKARTDLRRTREHLVSLGARPAELDGSLDALHVRSAYALSAPLAGTIVERSLTLGQVVGGDAAQRLFVVADLNTLWVMADVYEKDLALIQPGEDVRVTAAAWPQTAFGGRIDYVGDTVDAVTRTIKVRVVVDNHERRLKPEMFVNVTVRTPQSTPRLSVPLAAVHGEGSGHPYVFAALADDRFVRRPVTLGARLNDRVVVTAGLTAQDRVVTLGSILLKAKADQQSMS